MEAPVILTTMLDANHNVSRDPRQKAKCHSFTSEETEAPRVTLSRAIQSSDSNVGTP